MPRLDANNKIAAKRYSLYRIGSITKTFTATIILMLEEEGRLNDDLASKYLPDDMAHGLFGDYKNTVTIHQLLNHMSRVFTMPYSTKPSSTKPSSTS